MAVSAEALSTGAVPLRGGTPTGTSRGGLDRRPRAVADVVDAAGGGGRSGRFHRLRTRCADAAHQRRRRRRQELDTNLAIRDVTSVLAGTDRYNVLECSLEVLPAQDRRAMRHAAFSGSALRSDLTACSASTGANARGGTGT